jgi:hypothetical protein
MLEGRSLEVKICAKLDESGFGVGIFDGKGKKVNEHEVAGTAP